MSIVMVKHLNQLFKSKGNINIIIIISVQTEKEALYYFRQLV